MNKSILVVDDERDMTSLLKRSLEPELGCNVTIASSGEEALQCLNKHPFDLVLADIRMPGMDGLELLELIKRDNPDLTVIIMTAYGSIETAVGAMKSGAYDFIIKPFDYDELIVRLEKALERSQLIRENVRLQKKCLHEDDFQGLIGQSLPMKRIYDTIRMVANTDVTVLITGESGTGKDLTARAVHALSNRSDGPFVAVNCPTVPENILESELFGYKKGAFTHAVQNKKGLFQEAENGTLFLDEIGDISPSIQAKLLRVLQEKEFKPLGSSKTIKVNLRIIASTNQDLKEKIRKSEFREDLYYRLNVLPIKLPSLRERRTDIPMIASHLLKKHCAILNKPVKRISPALMDIFMNNRWEGNVRELENVIIRGILYASTNTLEPDDVGFQDQLPACFHSNQPSGISNTFFRKLPYKAAKERMLKRFNDMYIGNLLSQSKGNVSQAARQCGLERQALQQIMKRYDIKAAPYRKESDKEPH